MAFLYTNNFCLVAIHIKQLFDIRKLRYAFRIGTTYLRFKADPTDLKPLWLDLSAELSSGDYCNR